LATRVSDAAVTALQQMPRRHFSIAFVTNALSALHQEDSAPLLKIARASFNP